MSLSSNAGTLYAEVAAYERALDRTLAFCGVMARLRIDDRIVAINAKISEAQGQQIYVALQAIFGDSNLSSSQQELVPVVVPRRLRELIGECDDDG